MSHRRMNWLNGIQNQISFLHCGVLTNFSPTDWAANVFNNLHAWLNSNTAASQRVVNEKKNRNTKTVVEELLLNHNQSRQFCDRKLSLNFVSQVFFFLLLFLHPLILSKFDVKYYCQLLNWQLALLFLLVIRSVRKNSRPSRGIKDSVFLRI